MTLHWHGVHVPNADDGVAGVTQDAVRWVASSSTGSRADQAGTFWYHSHQVSHDQVSGGIFGAFVVVPRGTALGDVADRVTSLHLYGGVSTIDGVPGGEPAAAAPGTRVRVRMINTDNGPTAVWVSVALPDPRRRRHRRPRPDPGDRAAVLDHRGWTGRHGIILPADGSECGRAGAGRSCWDPGPATPSRARRGCSTCSGYGAPTPLDPSALASTPDPDPALRLRHRPAPRVHRGLPGPLLDDQRPPLSRRADVHGPRGRRRPDADREHVRRGPPDAPARAPRGRPRPRRGAGHRQSVVGRLARRPRRRHVTTSRSSPTTRASGWTTATTWPHPKQGLVAHLMYEGVTTPYRAGADTPNDPE